MKKVYFFVVTFALSANLLIAQTQPQPAASRPVVKTVNSNITDLSQYGVRIQPDTRLIIVMAALDVAGFNPKADTSFHQQLRKDLSGLDPDLRRRMHEFFDRSNNALETLRLEEIKRANPTLSETELKEKAKLTLTDQAARYVSLAYALSPAPELSEPARSTDLPGGLLEVLDFAPLVREFYRKSNIDEKLPEYIRKYQAVGDTLRPQIANTVSDMSAYLNTRPQLISTERVKTTIPKTNSKNSKKPALQNIEIREHPRNFYVVPDLLAVPNSVKFRVIGDDYFAIVGEKVQPETSTELRRAYLQFLVDPIVYKNAKEIITQRDAIRSILDEQKAAGAASVSPDVFLAVSRSLVAVADIRQRKQKHIAEVTREAQAAAAEKRAANSQEVKVVDNRLTFPKAESEAFAELSEAYENGAVLAFFFDEQLRGLESSSFDVTSSFADMITSFDAAKEKGLLTDSQRTRKEALIKLAKRREAASKQPEADDATLKIRNNELIKGLNDVENLLKGQDYDSAESRLMEMLGRFPGEPRILYARGRTASLSATGVFDEGLRNARLNKALALYLNVLQLKNEDTPAGLLSNTHVALGKIYEFYADVMEENKAAYKEAAIKQFEAAIALKRVENGSFDEAVAGKARLSKQ
ncbi:MAG: hypothetical protein ABI954_14885 [Pyrinomonadaceae bacterium]